jgi:hypothetical protein
MKRILITAPIRQDKETLKKYLKSLDELIIGNFEVKKYFILHNCFEDLQDCFDNDTILESYADDSKDVKNDITHQWYTNNLNAVAIMKNRIIEFTLANNFDYTFMVDSDLILQKETLNHLFKNLEIMKKHIMSEVFWTEWQKDSNAWGTNGWDFDSYNGDQEKFKAKGIFKVGGTGACILINNDVYRSGANYSALYNVSFSEWEDRAFCIRSVCNGFDIFMDTHYPANHLYR